MLGRIRSKDEARLAKRLSRQEPPNDGRRELKKPGRGEPERFVQINVFVENSVGYIDRRRALLE